MRVSRAKNQKWKPSLLKIDLQNLYIYEGEKVLISSFTLFHASIQSVHSAFISTRKSTESTHYSLLFDNHLNSLAFLMRLSLTLLTLTGRQDKDFSSHSRLPRGLHRKGKPSTPQQLLGLYHLDQWASRVLHLWCRDQ